MVLVAKIIYLTLIVIKACIALSGDDGYYEVLNKINYHNFEASYWIKGLVLSGKNVGKI